MKTKTLYTFILMIVLASAFLVSGCKMACCGEKGKEKCKKKCDLVPDPGPCKADFSKYYYDKKDKKCKEFFWGGCDGVVPFETMEECEKCKCNEK